jgi:hypothetical protein
LTRRKDDLARAAHALLQAEQDAPEPEEKPKLLQVSARRAAVARRRA